MGCHSNPPSLPAGNVANGQAFRDAGGTSCALQMISYHKPRRMALRLLTQLVLLEGKCGNYVHDTMYVHVYFCLHCYFKVSEINLKKTSVSIMLAHIQNTKRLLAFVELLIFMHPESFKSPHFFYLCHQNYSFYTVIAYRWICGLERSLRSVKPVLPNCRYSQVRDTADSAGCLPIR